MSSVFVGGLALGKISTVWLVVRDDVLGGLSFYSRNIRSGAGFPKSLAERDLRTARQNL